MSGDPRPSQRTGWQFAIDRGGTFTDCLAIDPAGAVHTTKVLSSDRAPVEAIEAILAEQGVELSTLDDGARIRVGTTVATNALLEREGIPTALVCNVGLGGVFEIGTQERPDLFALEIERPRPLHDWCLEVPGRRTAEGRVVTEVDADFARVRLEQARAEGARSIAIVCAHAFAFPEDESRLARLARDVGFEHVVCSFELAREIGLLARGETTIADAYLTPLLRGHVETLAAALPRANLRFMQSSGGLTTGERFRAPHALLSGPAGGVVATEAVARQAGHTRAIGFDMGGTSTDVSLVRDGQLERAFESVVGGVRVKAPMLRIHTVAAGGGSLCRFDGIRLTVGPESAGSRPGPICYDQRDEAGAPLARELALTDINLALGRVLPDRFPFALAEAPVERALESLRDALAAAGFERSVEEIAAGFFEIANANMAQAIIEVSVERGADPRDHVLVGFGGAGGQHVCAIAKRLGISEILLHPHAGLLSALGIGMAPTSWDGQRDGRGRLLGEGDRLDASVAHDWQDISESGWPILVAETRDEARVEYEVLLDLAYQGTDTALSISLGPIPRVESGHDPARPPAIDGRAMQSATWRDAFEVEHRARFGYVRAGRPIEIKVVRLRLSAREPALDLASQGAASRGGPAKAPGRGTRTTSAWFPRIGRVSAPVFEREALVPGDRLEGPALVLEKTGTVVLDPGFELEVDDAHVFRIRALDALDTRATESLDEADPVRLEVVGNRFMSIAEQMGAVLRNTSVSTNIKERLDYSCAVFDRAGRLVANAPHIPVHLGAMADTVAAIRRRFEPFEAGDVFVTNDPFEGGSHLPDITVVTPVFREESKKPDFFVASRGHHADLGGKTPGSMPADSVSLEEEGILIEAFPLVQGGRLDEDRIRRVLGAGRFPARRPDDNVADLEAMVAANRAGAVLLDQMVEELGERLVEVTMDQLHSAAAIKVALELAKLEPGVHAFEDALDDGTPIVARLEIEHASPAQLREGALPARMSIDFTGTGPAHAGNLNAPSAVVRAAIIYVLRSLVSDRIPLNGGCLAPVSIRIPADSLLDPPRGVAVVGGNVETSQRVVDVLLGALGRAAASQGTMNNVTFGDEVFGYYETIGGGAGATAKRDGASGVHTHMTNTRITDPEVLEARFPVRLEGFGLREGSGGHGRHRGGEGVVRHYRFLRPVTVSLLTERRERPPFGLEGGGVGGCGRNSVRSKSSGEWAPVPGRATLQLSEGDELRIETPGGGGFGRREPSQPIRRSRLELDPEQS